MRVRTLLASLAVALILVAGAVLLVQTLHDPGSDTPGVAVADGVQQIARGRYLAQAAGCIGCHTMRGGAEYAGGRTIATPFGDLYAPNITTDRTHGIGAWGADDFWRALHNGKSRDGRFLYPAFPYTDYTKINRADADAMYAYFMTVPAVAQANRPPALRFPYDQRWLLAGWRALYFQPGTFVPDATRSAQWNSGAYLVQGAGHCNACHANRNAVGATDNGMDLAGGLIPMLGWYAPSLSAEQGNGLGSWNSSDVVDLLRTGVSMRGAVFGPMAEVVQHSLQHLTSDDLGAMTAYLQALPPTVVAAPARQATLLAADSAIMQRGAAIYRDQCVACHKADGRGAPPAYPPLAGNQSVAAASTINAIRMVLNGGYPPVTAGNPRPYGMPPFGPSLDDADVAAAVSFIRGSWGNKAGAVSPDEVRSYRAVPIE
ncbi:MAG: c-type cytochrome [Herminiimonas sp.]|nr:c-type cytochrome [Herminiimonas sp.]